MIHHDSYLALRFSGYRGMSLLLFENAVLPSPSDSSRIMKRHGQEPSVFRSDQIRTLAAKRASVVRAQDLDVPFLYYRSVAIRESRGRRDAVRLVEASFTAKKK